MDIEYAREIDYKQKKLIEYYKTNKSKVHVTIVSFLVVILVLSVKSSLTQFSVSVQNKDGFSFYEEPFETFSIDFEKITPSRPKQFVVFDLKFLEANRILQQTNVKKIEKEARNFLKQKDWECIHLGHAGAKYDIIAFQNITIINPLMIKNDGDENMIKIIEEDIQGNMEWKYRKTRVKLEYIDIDKMKRQTITLYDTQAICLQHYYN